MCELVENAAESRWPVEERGTEKTEGVGEWRRGDGTGGTGGRCGVAQVEGYAMGARGDGAVLL